MKRVQFVDILYQNISFVPHINDCVHKASIIVTFRLFFQSYSCDSS